MKRNQITAFSCLTVLMLTACQTNYYRPGASDYTNKDYDEAFVAQTSSSAQNLYDFLADKTVLFQFGGAADATQLRYFAPDSNMYIWYPYSQKIEAGRWEIREDAQDGRLKVCYIIESDYPGYRSIIWNEDTFDCFTALNVLDNAYERVEGNPMGLELDGRGYAIRDAFYSMEDFARLRGVPPTSLTYLPTPYALTGIIE